ncbi:MAG: ATP-grasp protein [Planctomycetota bacterium]|nr:MAG: ATP-grasp protein [Planctomycetota bacterium]
MSAPRDLSSLRVLVLEGGLNSSLAAIRALGRAGVHVTVADHHRVSPGLWSRHAKARLRCPDPEQDKHAFLDWIVEHVAAHAYDAVFPMSDFTVIPLIDRRDDVEAHTRLAMAPSDQLRVAHDKAQTFALAEQAGVSMPETHVPANAEEAAALAPTLSYPRVVKPRSKEFWDGGRPLIHKVTARNFVTSPEELLAVWADVHRVAPNPLIQECIPGDGFGFFALRVDGEVKQVFGHRRLREYPLSGGASSLRESHLDADMEAEGRRMLDALNWDGVAMVEFKRDARDGRPKLMEVNGRFWGSLSLPLAADVNFPLLYLRALLGDELPTLARGFEDGVRCRALLPFDLLWLFASLKRPGRLRALGQFLRPDGWNCDVVSLRDPLPTLGACALLARRALDVASGRLTLDGERR